MALECSLHMLLIQNTKFESLHCLCQHKHVTFMLVNYNEEYQMIIKNNILVYQII